MNRASLINQIRKKQSYLCVGLDTELEKIPLHLGQTPEAAIQFNKAIIDATHDLCVAYKPNIAFYEAMGIAGWQVLAETIAYIPEDIMIIADAKRGDIGNTANQYAQAFFGELGVDAITIAPYMGRDSVEPFLTYEDKWGIVLGLTSNAGSTDFQFIKEGDYALWEKVILTAQQWGTPENLMFVIGATQTAHLERARSLAPNHFFLVPGIGAQGGSLFEVSKACLTADVGILVNSTRNIIYAGDKENFASTARNAATAVQQEMAQYLHSFG